MLDNDGFAKRAQQIASLPVAVPVNELGGYGPDGEVIYLAHPEGNPVMLNDSCPGASVNFASNGSVSFVVTRPDGVQFEILSESFDRFEKREIGVPSGNIWLDLSAADGTFRTPRIASLINPAFEINLSPASIRIVKTLRPKREMFYSTRFDLGDGQILTTVVSMALARTAAGPAIVRQVCLLNEGAKPVCGKLWAFFDLHGTQFKPYDMEIWYDMGLPLSPLETVMSCTVPYSDIVQIKRVSTAVSEGIQAVAATCDYRSFVGNTAQFTLLPEAVKRGSLLPAGAGDKLNRFSVPTIAANLFSLDLPGQSSAVMQQSLLFIADEKLAQQFRKTSSTEKPGYTGLCRSFTAASEQLLKKTPDVIKIVNMPISAGTQSADTCLQVKAPAAPAAIEFLNSVASGTSALYGRTFGRRIADGMELPFRDRCQDMWPMMKVNPAQVRADLVHTFGFMYHTTNHPIRTDHRLSFVEKNHGGFPRQYPSLWLDRTKPVTNDNRLFCDSAVWLLDALTHYLRETGDLSILTERVGCVVFVDNNDPNQGILGGKKTYLIAEVIVEILARYERLCADSPYGMVQIIYGDWCDPVDMFGTDRIGDPTRRGVGRGVSVRVSSQVFLSTLNIIDMFQSPAVGKLLKGKLKNEQIAVHFQQFACNLRQSILTYAWEDTGDTSGFIDSIHELTGDGKKPNVRKGQIGYTLGSMMPQREFDGIPRRVLTSMAFGLALLQAQRPYLPELPKRQAMIDTVLGSVDKLLHEPQVGLLLYSTPLANSETTRRMVGRMGIIPSGCSENGEYHHAQAFMHFFRMNVPGQQDKAWEQLGAILSTTRDARLLGPFDSMANSCASDADDPHFGAGMIFGFSGSADWIIETVERIVGLDLDATDSLRLHLRITPRMPSQLKGQLSFSRVLHYHTGAGKYRAIPLHVDIKPAQTGETPGVRINGKPVASAQVASLASVKQLNIEIVS